MDSKHILNIIVKTALDSKALDLKKIDLDGKSSLCEHILICHGTSKAHSRGISDQISLIFKKENIYPIGVEGYNEGSWILMDYNSVLIHIFLEETRTLYKLEELYHDYLITNVE